MDEPYESHRFLELPPWGSEPSSDVQFDGIDLSHPRIYLTAEEDIRVSASQMDPFEPWDPQARALRQQLAHAHDVDMRRIVPGRNPKDLFRTTCRATLAADDIVALACPT